MIDLGGDLIGYIGVFAAFVLAFIGNGWLKKRKGVKQERNRQKELDHENADDIRNRVDDVDRVRDDDIVYRD